ncbi:uroporphyrinogen-III C-methyltransferase [Wielerella bovis]|uniref:uroporphyrinogen-III C-methyltransferase n=1 Tax=Wielerella bovis TaxID=2917790 RepID=UPI002018C625|nr:uroporphyrinogen-III C-methyltransferase [Wielerella bovis]ULJ65726.1 uroporphyrinogen-III C-methyltransferase [Wielerella bovis]ULJ66231.1 uroporphyrinogen-III C-methyltransferase [Wielerella bovis]
MTDSQKPQENTEQTSVTEQKQPENQTAQTQITVLDKQPEKTQPIVIERQSNGKGLATGALVLSLLALGASGFLFVQGQNELKTQQLKVAQELDKAGLGDSQNAVLLQNTLIKQEELDKQLAQIVQNEKNTQERLSSINRAYAELLKGRVNWLVDEVEATLNVASQQLLLSGNTPVAITVLENIEQRLARFEQGDLLAIKQAVSADLTALKSTSYVNVSGTALRLDRLENSISGLPLMVDNTLQATNDKPEVVSQAGSFWTRAWDNTAALLKSMVEVRKLDNNDAMLIAPEQVYFVRENLRMRLLDARLAVLQHNNEVYQNDLAAIESAIKQYYDVQSPNTQAFLKELGELRTLEIRMVSDDALKGSLKAVRDYQDKLRTTTPIVLPETTITAPAPVASSTTPNTTAASEVATKPASAPSVQAASQATTETKSSSEPKAKPASEPKTDSKGTSA